jgi:predicted lipoprotein with Yx(FWY)xxD motif
MSRNRTALASAIVAVGLGATPVIVSAPSAAATTHRVGGAGAATEVRAQAAAGPATIQLHKTRLGMILVNARGFTVYAFGKDAKRQDRCVTISGCGSIWPLVKTSGRPRAGKGVKRSLLGTIKVGNNEQVTYAGHPLYTYTGDGFAGSTSYVGIRQFGGVWTALKASGATVR